MSSPGAEDAGISTACLDDLQVESALLSVIAEHRPVGTHRHWNVIPVLTKFKARVDKLSSVREAEGIEVWSDTNKAEDPNAIRAKLEEWYDLAALNDMVRDIADEVAARPCAQLSACLAGGHMGRDLGGRSRRRRGR